MTAWNCHLEENPGYRLVLDNIRKEMRRRRMKRGRRRGIWNRVRKRFARPPLPSIILANLRSINKKINAIRTYARYCNESREASLFCFTESWIPPDKPDSLYDVPGFTLIRLDRTTTTGGGICVYINDLWCRSYSVKVKISDADDPNVEILGLTPRPFYLPREFGCILLFAVYVPPRAHGKAAQAAKTIANCAHEL